MKSSATNYRSDGQIVYQNKYWTKLTVMPVSNNSSRMRSAGVVVLFLKLWTLELNEANDQLDISSLNYKTQYPRLNIIISSHVWIWIQAFLITGLDEDKWLASRPSRL